MCLQQMAHEIELAHLHQPCIIPCAVQHVIGHVRVLWRARLDVTDGDADVIVVIIAVTFAVLVPGGLDVFPRLLRLGERKTG